MTPSSTRAATPRRARLIELDNLTVVVIDNRSVSWPVPGRIAKRFETDGWHVREVDGHDHDALDAALSERVPGRPTAVVAVTGGAA